MTQMNIVVAKMRFFKKKIKNLKKKFKLKKKLKKNFQKYSNGQFGDGSTIQKNSPSKSLKGDLNSNYYLSISCIYDTCCGIVNDTNIYCSGCNRLNKLNK
jgi:putative component of toxin-antitoxin plasmid stabilization module